MMFKKIAITALACISLLCANSPAAAQDADCYKVLDQDGWTNIRDRKTGKVVARIDDGQNVLISHFNGGWGILKFPHNQFKIHSSRLFLTRRCFRFTPVEDDGYLNLRKKPNGTILERIPNGTALIILGETNNPKWDRVLLPNGSSGAVHGVRLELYN